MYEWQHVGATPTRVALACLMLRLFFFVDDDDADGVVDVVVSVVVVVLLMMQLVHALMWLVLLMMMLLPVSYTHLTLPTKRIVEDVVACVVVTKNRNVNNISYV